MNYRLDEDRGMVKLSGLSEKDSYLQLPRIERSAIKFLWADDWWDGPKSGLLVYDGTKYWFEVFSESEDPDFADYYRRFFIIQLSDEQMKEEEYWHNLFREKVGHHWDFNENQREALAKLRPEKVRNEFYDLYRKRRPRDFSDSPVVGWFQT